MIFSDQFPGEELRILEDITCQAVLSTDPLTSTVLMKLACPAELLA